MKALRLALSSLCLTLSGCAFDGFTLSYTHGEDTISASAYRRESGKRVVGPKPLNQK